MTRVCVDITDIGDKDDCHVYWCEEPRSTEYEKRRAECIAKLVADELGRIGSTERKGTKGK